VGVASRGFCGGAARGGGILQRSTHSDVAVLTEQVTSVRMDGEDGGVTIRGVATTDELTVRRTIRYRGDLPEDPTFRLEEGVLVLAGCGRFCSVDYEVDLPADLPVTGHNRNGDVVLEEVGEVDARTDNGDLRIESSTGPITARTSNGDIEITVDTAMDVSARTSNGDVTATVPEASYRITTNTSNGNETLELTSDPAGEYRLDLSTSNGDITVRTG
jgi:hypothetical protein